VPDLTQVIDSLGVLRGMTAQNAQFRESNILTFDVMGSPLPADTWQVRIYSVAWRIERESGILVGSDDPEDQLAGAVRVLNGQPIIDVDVRRPSLDTTFVFEGCALRIFPVTALVDKRMWQQWSLHAPSGRILDIGPGTSFSVRGRKTGGT
jgi:hypothetical protein